MSDTPRTVHATNYAGTLSSFAHQRRYLFDQMGLMERELEGLRTDAARYRAVRGLLDGGKWSDTPFFYSAACPPDEKYVTCANFDQMADRLCEEPQ